MLTCVCLFFFPSFFNSQNASNCWHAFYKSQMTAFWNYCSIKQKGHHLYIEENEHCFWLNYPFKPSLACIRLFKSSKKPTFITRKRMILKDDCNSVPDAVLLFVFHECQSPLNTCIRSSPVSRGLLQLYYACEWAETCKYSFTCVCSLLAW